MGMAIERFSVWQVDLNPTKGSEQAGSRPVLVVSPDPMNDKLRTVIVAPMTTRLRGWPTRVPIRHERKKGEVAPDQLGAIDKTRLTLAMGDLNSTYHNQVLSVLADIFAE